MAHLTKSLFIAAPVEVVDGIVRDQRRWPEFFVGMEEPESIEGDGGPGTVTTFNLVSFGIRMAETDRVIDERHDPDGSTHWRWEFEGTTKGWMTCDHQPTDGGTTIHTQFQYTLPGSVLGKIVDVLVLERIQKRDFNASLENLKVLAEASVPSEVTT